MRVAIAAGDRVGAEALRRAVTDAGRQVAWVARDGVEAARLARSDPPDVLLLDIDIPALDAVEVTRRVMKESPCAILLVIPATGGRVSRVYEAMGLGAMDALTTPALDMEGELTGAQQLGRHLAIVEKLLVRRPTPVPRAGIAASAAAFPLVAIGASTGGPQALAAILARLPSDLQAALVIVQHIEEEFASGLASWLTDLTGFRVELARAGDAPRVGTALLAATGDHLVLEANRTFGYTVEPAALIYRPSVDVLFRSLVSYTPTGTAVLLTGMGRDGAEGLLDLRRAGWTTISQDRETSVVYGMPMAAAELGAAEHILPVEGIAPTIAASVARARRSNR